jgi:phosphate transport system permease protein
MLFAIPLAVLGAIYTAYFMRPALRALVKPSIELMAALPTVILGFLAGLWLAPLIERALLGVLACFVLLPLVVLATSFGYSRAPRALTRFLPEGCEALVLIPVICLATWFALAVGQALEVAFFAGNLAHWLNVEYGLTYDQRNSLVVAIAIGFAVIPTIFSISEDAVFSVPRHLTMGSLALGATPWQTAIRVVLLTASPGIFSAVMIGMGRAVGETMIVLMTTGNTPIMDVNLFQGLRALSANIAVEMPESEVDGTHYRILFLAAMVLFLVTFVVNTLAEIVRQRLRRRYASL